jgi:tetratricopeptide (TPR) repeat protein
MRACSLLLALAVVACGAFSRAEERAWQVTGELVGLKPGSESTVVIELPTKARIEVPLAALSEADRQVVRSRSEGSRQPVAATGPVVVRGPTGRVSVPVPESLKGVETDAIWCRTAAEAVDVYRLYLAGDGLSVEDRVAADARLGEWSKRAAEKRVRMGDAWLPPEQRTQARRIAHDQFVHAIEVIRLGNWTLAEDELKKASRLDPDLAAAELVLGLGYFLLKPKVAAESAGNLAKAIDFFAEAVRRDPDNVNALNDLALAEMFGGKYAAGVSHLVRAAVVGLDDQVIADNLGLIIRDAPGLRPKMPEKLLTELNECYRNLLRHPRLKPLGTTGAYMLKSATGVPIPAVKGSQSIVDFAKHLDEPAEWIADSQRGAATVVGDGFLLTTMRLVPDATEILVEDPTAPGRQLPAREVASSGDSGLFLLRCDGLIAKPLPVAAAGPVVGDEVSVGGVGVDGRNRTAARPTRGRVVAGTVSTAASTAASGFIHAGAFARGHGGGPIVDRRGRLVGLEAPLPRTDSIGVAHGMGLPIDWAWPLLHENLPDLQAAAAGDDPPADWALADTRSEAATVGLICRRKASGRQSK